MPDDDVSAAQATLGAIAAGVITLTGFVLTAVTLVVQSVQSMSPRLAGVLGYFERSLVLFGALTGTAGPRSSTWPSPRSSSTAPTRCRSTAVCVPCSTPWPGPSPRTARQP